MQRGKLVKTPAEIEKMTRAGVILADVLKKVAAAVKPGVTGSQLDSLAYELITKAGGKAIFKGYRPEGAEEPYPATICVSPNNVVVHGVPNDKPLKNGDIVSIDMGVGVEGYCADAAVTVPVGKASPQALALIDAARVALERAIAVAVPGATLGDIGHAVESCAKEFGVKVAKGLTGHGIGTGLHEDPYVLNEGKPGTGQKLVPGMCLALEPMLAIGTGRIKQLPDESYGTGDDSLAAHFEHTIVITETGNKIITA